MNQKTKRLATAAACSCIAIAFIALTKASYPGTDYATGIITQPAAISATYLSNNNQLVISQIGPVMPAESNCMILHGPKTAWLIISEGGPAPSELGKPGKVQAKMNKL